MKQSGTWGDAVTVLALFAIDPSGLGGVSVRGGPGPVRDRWVALLGAGMAEGSPVKRMPPHVGDDRLLGGLDLAATLRSGRPVWQAGLLAETVGGIAILAMAERMEPSTAARLNAALDRGVITGPPGGITADQASRFGIVALDEGIDQDEHPPLSLLDRLAFQIDLTSISLRDAETPDWTTRDLAAARQRLPGVTAPDRATESVCGVAMALGVDSTRAPLFALRAAHAAAAFNGRTFVNEEDLALASRLVLAPRATRLPADEEPEEEATQAPEPEPPSDDAETDQEPPSDRPLEDVVLEAALASLPPDLLSALAAGTARSQQSRTSGRAGKAQVSRRRGRPIGARPGPLRDGARLNLLETLKAAAPWQKLRQEGPKQPGRMAIRPDDFRIVRFKHRSETTTIFTVDASGSAALHRLGEAKGAVELLLADCYVRRDQVALIAFRGQAAQVLLPPTGSLTRAKHCLSGLPGGGATPLAAGLDMAAALADGERRRGRTPLIVVLTDGRANMTRDGTGGRPRAEEEALASARLTRAAGLMALFVDTSPRPNPFAQKLAGEMGARYVPLPQADSAAVSRAVMAAART